MTPAFELSSETYKDLESLAKPFTDRSPEDVIRRLITVSRASESKVPGRVEGVLASGTAIPNGLELRFNYKKKLLPAVTREDRIWIGDTAFDSPSAAAVAAAELLGFPGRSLNGWWYWEYQNDGHHWRRLSGLRDRARVVRRKRRR